MNLQIGSTLRVVGAILVLNDGSWLVGPALDFRLADTWQTGELENDLSLCTIRIMSDLLSVRYEYLSLVCVLDRAKLGSIPGET